MPHAVTAKTDAPFEVIGTWSGKGPAIPVSSPGSGQAVYEITDAEMTAFRAVGHHYEGGVPAWTRPPGGALTQATDSRPWVELVPALTELDVGDAGTLVTFNALNASKAPTTFTGVRRVELSDGRKIRLSFTGGSATRTVPTSRPYDVHIVPTPDYRVEGEARVVVYATNLEP